METLAVYYPVYYVRLVPETKTAHQEPTMTTTDLISAVRARLSTNAMECLASVARTQEDQDAMIGSDLDVGSLNTDKLLATCLNGAENDNVIAGWTEYVDVIGRVAAGHFYQGR